MPNVLDKLRGRVKEARGKLKSRMKEVTGGKMRPGILEGSSNPGLMKGDAVGRLKSKIEGVRKRIQSKAQRLGGAGKFSDTTPKSKREKRGF